MAVESSTRRQRSLMSDVSKIEWTDGKSEQSVQAGDQEWVCMGKPVTWLAQRQSVVDIESQFWEIGVWLAVMGFKIATAVIAAVNTCVFVALKYCCPPISIFWRAPGVPMALSVPALPRIVGCATNCIFSDRCTDLFPHFLRSTSSPQCTGLAPLSGGHGGLRLSRMFAAPKGRRAPLTRNLDLNSGAEMAHSGKPIAPGSIHVKPHRWPPCFALRTPLKTKRPPPFVFLNRKAGLLGGALYRAFRSLSHA